METMTSEAERLRPADAGEPRPQAFDPDRIVVGYDRDSDTLMVHFYGRGVPGISVHRGDGWYVRWNRERTCPIGLQIEEFLARAVRDEPDLLRALDLAELRGITVEEVARIRRAIARDRLRRDPDDGLLRLFPRLGPPTPLRPDGGVDGGADGEPTAR